MATVPKVEVGTDYKEKYGFFVPEEYVFKAKRGLNPDIVKEISWMKQEPEWMTKMRLRSLEIFRKKPMPTWGADLSFFFQAEDGIRDYKVTGVQTCALPI